MIKDILDLLNSQDWFVGDEDIDIAKGKYKAPTKLSEIKQTRLRNNYINGNK